MKVKVGCVVSLLKQFLFSMQRFYATRISFICVKYLLISLLVVLLFSLNMLAFTDFLPYFSRVAWAMLASIFYTKVRFYAATVLKLSLLVEFLVFFAKYIFVDSGFCISYFQCHWCNI